MRINAEWEWLRVLMQKSINQKTASKYEPVLQTWTKIPTWGHMCMALQIQITGNQRLGQKPIQWKALDYNHNSGWMKFHNSALTRRLKICI